MSLGDIAELPYAEIQIDPVLTLRQLQADDAEALFELIDDERDYLGKYLTWVNGIQELEDIKKFIAENIEKRRAGSTYGYGIFYGGELVGHASLMHINDGEDPEVGYWISSGWAGRGITTKVAKALVKLGFEKLNLERIALKVHINNTASNRIAAKVGGELVRQEHDPRIGRGLANVWLVKAS